MNKKILLIGGAGYIGCVLTRYFLDKEYLVISLDNLIYKNDQTFEQFKSHKNVKKSVMDAAILGFTTYGIYETTNAAIMRNWQFKYVVMDTLWGSILYSIVTFLTLSALN